MLRGAFWYEKVLCICFYFQFVFGKWKLAKKMVTLILGCNDWNECEMMKTFWMISNILSLIFTTLSSSISSLKLSSDKLSFLLKISRILLKVREFRYFRFHDSDSYGLLAYYVWTIWHTLLAWYCHSFQLHFCFHLGFILPNTEPIRKKRHWWLD